MLMCVNRKMICWNYSRKRWRSDKGEWRRVWIQLYLVRTSANVTIYLQYNNNNNNSVLPSDLRASHLPGRHSTTWPVPPACFALVIFWIQSHIFAQVFLNWDPTIYISFLARIIGMNHHAQLLVEWGLMSSVPGLVSNLDPLDIRCPSS
jgi:hypothetical protein